MALGAGIGEQRDDQPYRLSRSTTNRRYLDEASPTV
jgi:hypothetical protein